MSNRESNQNLNGNGAGDEIDGLKPGDMSRLNFPWHKKLLLKFFPRQFFKLFAKEIDLDDKKIELAEKLFSEAKRIDIQPLNSKNGRGFTIFIDNKLSLWFNQDGDHFVFDGFEMGKYADGDVTVFDSLNQD